MRPASLGRNLHDGQDPPRLLHSLQESKSSVLSLAATDDCIFSGSQNRDILVWDKKTFTLKATLRGHTGSVLALEYAKDRNWLFSSGGDSTIRVWCTKTLSPLYVIDPYLEHSSGDLFSLAWSPTLQTIFVGCKNTSLQWFHFSRSPSPSESSASLQDAVPSGYATPNLSAPRKAHKFFDSYPQYLRKPADKNARNGYLPGRESPESDSYSDIPIPQAYFNIPASNVVDSAHWGYIYCMNVIDDGNGVRLATGSGDESVKLWDCSGHAPTLIHEFNCGHGAILALVARGDTLAAGCQGGYVKILDLETRTSVRTIIVQEGVDILSLSVFDGDLYTCSEGGCVKRWSSSFDCTAAWKAHDGIVLSSIITECSGGGSCLVTGGGDSNIKVWELSASNTTKATTAKPVDFGHTPGTDSISETLLYALYKFIAIPSVSSQPAHKEDCRQAAIWLKKCFSQLGAQAALLPTGENGNPIVLGTFEGRKSDQPLPRILVYGHYDVIPAPPEGWGSDPFTLTGKNGYLYGRGVTDDKGPILAIACAAADLLARRALGVDLVFLIEGEEEIGSPRFAETVRRHKGAIGHVDEILVSNSTWIAEDRACLTYGLRGVVHCNLVISNAMPDLHSGVEGGALAEPMADMVKLLATLTSGQGRIQIPHFYDHVRPQTEEEEELYKLLSEVTQKPASLLRSRWREPSLTMHNIEISGPKNSTIIPSTVKAQISLRIVPDQGLDIIVQSLVDYMKSTFDGFRTPNMLQAEVVHTADWWLGELDDPYFKALESAVKEEWGMEPLRIREGGSIPSVPWLEKEFKCHTLHFPMGQSSDQAHLPNERISLVNLQKGKAVVEKFLLAVAAGDFVSSAPIPTTSS